MIHNLGFEPTVTCPPLISIGSGVISNPNFFDDASKGQGLVECQSWKYVQKCFVQPSLVQQGFYQISI